MFQSRVLATLALGAAVVVALSGCSSSPSAPSGAAGGGASTAATKTSGAATATPVAKPPADHAIVTIKSGAFTPADLTVKVGARVTWNNADSRAHTVTFDSGGVSSPSIPPGAVASHVFKTAGTFTYHCAIHPEEKGKVVVK